MEVNMSLFLSRLILNANHNRTRSERERPYELHRTISIAWEDPASARILMRMEEGGPGIADVIVQSLTEPDWSRLSAPCDYLLRVEGPKRMGLQALMNGQYLQFRLRCRPTKMIGARDNPDRGKRRGLSAKHEILEWLHRKAKASGFEVVEASFNRVYWYDSRNGIKGKPIGSVLFDGILAVTDSDRLREAVRSGIGTQKAFGFGLLSLAPTRYDD